MIAGCSKSMADFNVSAQVLKMVFRLTSEHFHMRSNTWSRFRLWWFRREINYAVNLYTLLYDFKYFERLWLCVNHLNYLRRIIYGNVAKNKRKIVPYNICIRPVFSEVFSYLSRVFWSFDHGEVLLRKPGTSLYFRWPFCGELCVVIATIMYHNRSHLLARLFTAGRCFEVRSYRFWW